MARRKSIMLKGASPSPPIVNTIHTMYLTCSIRFKCHIPTRHLQQDPKIIRRPAIGGTPYVGLTSDLHLHDRQYSFKPGMQSSNVCPSSLLSRRHPKVPLCIYPGCHIANWVSWRSRNHQASQQSHGMYKKCNLRT